MGPLFWLLAALVCWWLFQQTRKPNKFPPGPVRLPLVGTLWRSHSGQGPAFIRHQRMAQKYGKVVGYYFFSQPAVMVFDAELARQMFSTNQSAGRPHLDVMLKRTFGQLRGLLFGEGKAWELHRRFALQHLRDLGLGRSSLEVIIQREVTELVDRLTELKSQPVSVSNLYNIYMVNVPWEIVASSRLSPEDGRLGVVLEGSSDLSSQATGLAGVVNILFGRLLSGTLSKTLYRGMERNRDQLISIFQDEIAAHRRTLNDASPRDFIDTYLIEQKKSPERSQEFDELTLYAVLMDLFTAATGTNTLTLEWATLFLLLYPECQRRARRELRAVVDAGRPVTLEDMPRLPYTQALVAETLRRSSVLALAVPHRATADITFNGWRIPAETWLYVNLYAVHHDAKYWGDPLQFRPERFLRDGRYTPDKHLIPFGVGKRACMGESLAKWEQFLFLANIIHRFEVTSPPEDPPPKFEYLSGARSAPAPFRAVFRPLST